MPLCEQHHMTLTCGKQNIVFTHALTRGTGTLATSEHVVSADANQSDRLNLRRVIARSCFKHASLLAVAPRLPLTTAGFVILIVKPTELSQLAASITTCDSQAYNMTQHVYPCSDIVQLCLVCMLMGWRNICLKLLTLMHLHSWELWCRCFCMLMTSF